MEKILQRLVLLVYNHTTRCARCRNATIRSELNHVCLHVLAGAVLAAIQQFGIHFWEGEDKEEKRGGAS